MGEKPTYEELVQRVKELEKKAARNKQEDLLLPKREEDWSLLDKIPVGISVSTPEGRILQTNSGVLKIFGYNSKKDFMNRGANTHWLDPEKDRKKFIEHLTKKGRVDYFRAPFKRKDGSVFLGSITAIMKSTDKGPLIFTSYLDVSQQKQIEEALQKSEEKYRLLIENLPSVTWVANEHGHTTFISPNVERVLGYGQEEIYKGGKAIWSDRIHPDDKPLVNKSLEMMFAGKQKYDLEFRIQRKDGEWIWVHDMALMAYEENNTQYAFGVFSDIKKRKEAENRLKELMELDEKILYGSPVAFVLHDRDLRVIRVSRAYEMTTGFGTDEVLGKKVQEFMPEGHARDIVIEGLEKARDDGQQIGPREILGPTRSKRFLSETILPVFDADGRVSNVLSVLEDVTERKRADKELRENELKFRTLFEEALNPILVVDEHGRYIDANPAALQFLECDRQELLEKEVWDFCPPGWMEKEKEKDAPFTSRRTVETNYFVKGTIKTLLLNVVPLTMLGKKVLYGIGQDITHRKQAEEHMRLMYSAMEQTSDGIAVVDLNGDIVYLNNAFAKVHGYSRDELINKNLSVFHTPEQMPAVKKANETIKTKGEFVGEIWHVRRNGTVFPALMHNSNLTDDNGNLVGMIGAMRDISSIKAVQDELEKKEEELRTKAENLEEMNTALRVLLKEREKDKAQIEDTVLANVKDLVFPYIERLNKTPLDRNQLFCIDILKSNLEEIVSPFGRKLSSRFLGLTPTEIQVANLVKDGKATKEIAEFMNLSPKTIEFHRDNIRKKLGIKKTRRNLRTYLLSM